MEIYVLIVRGRGLLVFIFAVRGPSLEHLDRPFGEELMRGVVWYGGSLLGWAVIITESNVVAATPLTVLGLPALTALGLSLVGVGVRRGSGLDLKVQSEGGQLLEAVTGAIVGGFFVFYVVLVEGQSPLLVLVYVLATVGGPLIWRWDWRRAKTDS